VNSLESIFSDEFIIKVKEFVEIEEKQQDGKCKLRFEFQGENFYILKTEHNFFEHYKNIFNKNDYRILRKICDGIILREEEILFIELKKTLSISNFKKALSQLIATYIKTRILLENFWDFKNNPIILVIGKCSINKKDIYSEHKQSIALPSLENLELVFYKLTKNKKTNLKILSFENRKIELYKEVVNTFSKFQKDNVTIFLKTCDDCNNL